jgi:hypothetical protein
MDLSSHDVLFLLGAIELAACAGCALYWLIGRGPEARGPGSPRRRAARPPDAGPAAVAAGPAPEPPPPASASASPVGPGPAAAAPVDDLADTGRHHVPDGLLHSVTYRLSADLRARARVPGPTGGPSGRIPGQGRACDDVPLPT